METTKKQKKSICSVGIYVLSEETGTKEENELFIGEFKEQFPQYVIEGKSDELYDVVMPRLKKLNKENEKADEQLHKWLLVLPDEMPLFAEDASREETEFMVVHLKEREYDEGDDEEEEDDRVTYEETFTDMCSDFTNCQGVVFWHKEKETMKEFVSSLLL
jgi:hypothetical protein